MSTQHTVTGMQAQRIMRDLLLLFSFSLLPACRDIRIIEAGTDVHVLDPLLGVNAGPTAVGDGTHAGDDMSAPYNDIGVLAIRTHDQTLGSDRSIDIADIYTIDADPTKCSSYNFRTADAYYAQILATHFQPYLRIGNSNGTPLGRAVPDYGTGAGPSVSWSWWVQAIEHIIAHYLGVNDHLITDPVCTTDVPVSTCPDYIEIWNEPTSPEFWIPDSPTSTEYVHFAELFVELVARAKTTAAISPCAADHVTKVGGPGFGCAACLPEVKTTGRCIYVQNFIADLIVRYGLHPETPGPDFISWHAYSHEPADFALMAKYYDDQRDLLALVTHLQMENHITEWNTQLGGDAGRGTGKGPAELTGAWIELQMDSVQQSFFYRGVDFASAVPPTDPDGMYGLLKLVSAPASPIKAIGSAFDLWAQFYADATTASTTAAKRWLKSDCPDCDDRVYRLVAQRSTGGYEALVANLSSDKCYFRLLDPSGRLIDKDVLETTVIHDDGSVETRVGAFVALEPNAAELIRSH
jgi:hypothetical protein